MSRGLVLCTLRHVLSTPLNIPPPPTPGLVLCASGELHVWVPELSAEEALLSMGVQRLVPGQAGYAEQQARLHALQHDEAQVQGQGEREGGMYI
jgi:hypothetical protein